jgi:hypothetical protein
MLATNPTRRQWRTGLLLGAFILLFGWLLVGHVLELADEKATDTAARVASSVAIDSIAARPIVIPELTVSREPGGIIRIDETVQVREDCDGERLERVAVWPNGRSEQVTPMEGADSWKGGSFTSELPPGVHHVWVRYHWPEEALPLLYFIRADFREAKCKSGFKGEYLVLYREMDPG